MWFIREPKLHPGLFLKIAQKVFGYFEKCAVAIKEDLADEIDVYMNIFKMFGKRAVNEFINNPDETS